jgi:hypothetical protein
MSQNRRNIENQGVFINIPYEKSYERIFVATVASLISIGKTPRCTLEIPETGEGRLKRILDLIKSCYASIHELSRVGQPVRFNMPFELGLACAISRSGEGTHTFILFEKKPYRLDKTLSDIKGYDPYIHNGNMKGAVYCVLDSLGCQNNTPKPSKVFRFSTDLWQSVIQLKKENGMPIIFNRTLFLQLVSIGLELAVTRGFINKE